MGNEIDSLDFDELASQLEDFASYCSASEIHGLISGLASVGCANDLERVKNIVSKHVEAETLGQRADEAISSMCLVSNAQLNDTDFTFSLLLPDDDEELQSRISALSQWTQGYLIGFGTGVKKTDHEFSEDVQEILRDLVNISNVDDELDEDNPDDIEEREVAYTELQEYIRTSVMVIYSDFVSAGSVGTSGKKKPSNVDDNTVH